MQSRLIITLAKPNGGVMLQASTEIGERILLQMGEEPALIVEFFAVFSRFEYALKRAGYWHRVDGGVGISWNNFARECDGQFMKEGSGGILAEAVRYFSVYPPMRLGVSDGALKWEPLSHDSSKPPLQRLLEAVRQVRNNLFHGGKFPGGPVPEASRNELLLSHGLTILTVTLSLKHDAAVRVNGYFTLPLF